MIWKHRLSTFRSKHFKHREPNNANTVSILNFVALKNPIYNFRKFCMSLLGVLIKISWNIDSVYIFCALHVIILVWTFQRAKLS